MKSVRALTSALVDYAGLFPPAGLDMQSSVRNYAGYVRGPDSAMLGRFIVPVTRLAEFGENARHLLPRGEKHRPWLLSVLLGANPESEIQSVLKFNCEHWTESELGHCAIDTVEFKAETSADISRVRAVLPASYRAFVELTDGAFEAGLDAIGNAGFAAKIRTGGVEPGAFPSAQSIVAFMADCKDRVISFKATAGLHHIVCGRYPLTYEANSPKAAMFGFLNLFASAVFLYAGIGNKEAISILLEDDPREFRFEESQLNWRDRSVTVEQIELARTFAGSFGSCSFTEPVNELRELLAAKEVHA